MVQMGSMIPVIIICILGKREVSKLSLFWSLMIFCFLAEDKGTYAIVMLSVCVYICASMWHFACKHDISRR